MKVLLKSLRGLDFGTLFYITINPRARSTYEKLKKEKNLDSLRLTDYNFTKGVYSYDKILWEDGSTSDTEYIENAIKADWLDAYLEI